MPVVRHHARVDAAERQAASDGGQTDHSNVLSRSLRAQSSRAFSLTLVLCITAGFLIALAICERVMSLSPSRSLSFASLAGSAVGALLLRLRRDRPEDPEWLRFWAPVGEAIAVSATACRWVAESNAAPGWLSDSAVVGLYVMPIAAGFVVGRVRLRSLPLSSRPQIEARFRRRIYGFRWPYVRRAMVVLAVLIAAYALFAAVVVVVRLVT